MFLAYNLQPQNDKKDKIKKLIKLKKSKKRYKHLFQWTNKFSHITKNDKYIYYIIYS